MVLPFDLDFMLKSCLLIIAPVLIRLLPNYSRLLRVTHILPVILVCVMKLIDDKIAIFYLENKHL